MSEDDPTARLEAAIAAKLAQPLPGFVNALLISNLLRRRIRTIIEALDENSGLESPSALAAINADLAELQAQIRAIEAYDLTASGEHPPDRFPGLME